MGTTESLSLHLHGNIKLNMQISTLRWNKNRMYKNSYCAKFVTKTSNTHDNWKLAAMKKSVKEITKHKIVKLTLRISTKHFILHKMKRRFKQATLIFQEMQEYLSLSQVELFSFHNVICGGKFPMLIVPRSAGTFPAIFIFKKSNPKNPQ